MNSKDERDAAPAGNGRRQEQQGQAHYTRETALLVALARGWSLTTFEAVADLGDPWLPSTVEHLRKRYGLDIQQHSDGKYFCPPEAQEQAAHVLALVQGGAA